MQTRLSAHRLPALLAVFALTGCSSLTIPPAATPSPATPTTSLPATPGSTVSRSESEAEFDRLIARQDRVYRVIAPLIVKNAVLCKTAARPLLGFTAKNRYSFPAELRDAAVARLGKGDELRVVQVLDGSGAQRAGVQRGDALLSIAGKTLPLGPQAETDTARLLAPLLKQTTEVDVQVLRNEAPITLKVALTTACAYTVDIGNAPHVNAYSDGRRIMVKADRIALYMLARAGFNPTVAVDTLERLARRYPATVLNSYTALHPWTEDRKRQMVDTVAEIRKRQASKKSLVP